MPLSGCVSLQHDYPSLSLKILWSDERVLFSYFLFRRLIMINSTSYLVMTEKTKEIFRGLKVTCKGRNSVVLRTKYGQNFHSSLDHFVSSCVSRRPPRTIITVKQYSCHCCCLELYQDLNGSLIRYCTVENNKDWENENSSNFTSGESKSSPGE